MEALAALSTAGLDYVLLLFLRVSGLTISSPVFGRQNIPNMAKIAYSLALAYFFFTALPVPEPGLLAYSDVFMYVLMCAKELLIGMVMGYMLNLFFSGTFVTGQFIDMQVGFGMANVFDVQSNSSVPVFGNLLNVAVMLAFYGAGGMERLLYLLKLTFEHIPVGNVGLSIEMAAVAAEMFCQMFVLAVRMALPVIASSIVVEVLLGVMVRTVPQMHVFVIGMPLQVVLGLLVFIMTLGMFGSLTNELFESIFIGIEQVFAHMVA